MATPNTFLIPELTLPEEQGYAPETGVIMQTPVRLGIKKDNSDLWTLPIEPLVSMRGKKTVAISNVLKKKKSGSIKELWSIDDYEITIIGSLYSNQEGVYPAEQVARLKRLIETEGTVIIQSVLTDALGVREIVITNWEMSDDKGVEWQNFRVTAISDNDDIDLIV